MKMIRPKKLTNIFSEIGLQIYTVSAHNVSNFKKFLEKSVLQSILIKPSLPNEILDTICSFESS